ncbi:hypothetical protein ELR57_12820 [Cohnella sp. AR92]|nr:hypothetical protein ELR57_12820 [Cohnella sp. AR92]
MLGHRKSETEEKEELAASDAERELASLLTEGGLEDRNAEEEAVAKLSPRWEVRIQTERDPVAEETALYRRMAKEVDGRYGDEGK